jgi:hypothetical protein
VFELIGIFDKSTRRFVTPPKLKSLSVFSRSVAFIFIVWETVVLGGGPLSKVCVESNSRTQNKYCTHNYLPFVRRVEIWSR